MRSPIFQYAADLHREMRQEFELILEAAYAAAEEGAHGSMLNVLGRREGIDPYSLLTGPWSRVAKYASRELEDWFEQKGRPSVSQFEREWFANWQGEIPEPDADEFDPTDTYRVLQSNGDLWMESTDEKHNRNAQAEIPGSFIQRQYMREASFEWRDC